MNFQEQEERIEETLKSIRFFDHPKDLFRHLFYAMEMTLSEANWHQLLRHNRGTHFTFGEPTVDWGYTIPPHVREAGLTEMFSQLMEDAERLFDQMQQECPNIASYCVTNAHHRMVKATANLWELYHLINLRTSPEAQWDIRSTFEQLYMELEKHHPVLARYAKRRG